ncbi:MAG TPA: SHOCT domain-containing protein [Mycobacterium sp.]|jgi:hypothetical protein|nr:SHOCT domain-containing protein [Mycobacterium sp.]
MSRRSGPRIAITSAILTLVIAGVGLVATLILNAFVLDEYDAYGEVPIPGSTSLHLPAGEVTVSFHTMVTGSPSIGFPIPDLKFTITPPAAVPKPEVTDSVGGTTTVNSNTHVQVWVVEIPKEGTYDVVADGNVNGYISPRLAFGHGSSYGWLTWVFGGLLAVGVVELVAALFWFARSTKAARPLGPEELVSDQGVRLEQLKQLAARRDSGALTDAEFDAEKRRILEG